MSDDDEDKSKSATGYAFIIAILWIITLCNVSEAKASEHGLYDYWRYGLNRLIISAIIIGISIISCFIGICGLLTKSEECMITSSGLITATTIVCIVINIVFTYYFIATNNSAKDIQFDQTGHTFLDMLQILSYITIICDYILTVPLACGVCMLGPMIKEFCKKDSISGTSAPITYNTGSSNI